MSTYTVVNTNETVEYTDADRDYLKQHSWDMGAGYGHTGWSLTAMRCGGNYKKLGARKTHANLNDRPIGHWDGDEWVSTPAAPAPKPTRQPTPKTNTDASTNHWEEQYHVAQANVILLQGENTRLRARLAQLGVSVTGPLGLATIS